MPSILDSLFALVLSATTLQASNAAAAGTVVLVVAEQDLPKLWRYARGRAPGFDEALLRQHGHACVTLGYVIESDGRPSTVRVLKASPPEVFDAKAIATLNQVRFKLGPANEARVPVYSTITYTASRRMGGNAGRDADRSGSRRALAEVTPLGRSRS